jgi:hypothetical protein
MSTIFEWFISEAIFRRNSLLSDHIDLIIHIQLRREGIALKLILYLHKAIVTFLWRHVDPELLMMHRT